MGGTAYEADVAMDAAAGDEQPRVGIVHDWDGLTDYEMRRAEMLAELGFAAFAVDVYGKGVRPTTTEAKQAETGKLYKDRDALRARLAAGLETARELEGVDDEDVVVIGYCFGGAAVLELARSGADTEGFVSFHGGLGTPEGQPNAQVRARVRVLHGSGTRWHRCRPLRRWPMR